uniref:Uncharacterized protein n=1 Tax=Romanomermis culicivorax TaxID=13658 RepID=A0A915ICE5_ROMCU
MAVTWAYDQKVRQQIRNEYSLVELSPNDCDAVEDCKFSNDCKRCKAQPADMRASENDRRQPPTEPSGTKIPLPFGNVMSIAFRSFPPKKAIGLSLSSSFVPLSSCKKANPVNIVLEMCNNSVNVIV